RYERHDWDRPAMSAEERARISTDDEARFDAKVAASLAVANSEAPVALRLAAGLDKKKVPSSPHLRGLQSSAAPSPDGWVRLALDTRVPGVEGPATPPTPQSFTIQLEPAMFVDNFRCQAACDADDYNVARLRSSSVSLDVLARAATVRD